MKKKNILFVCKFNRFRSKVAETYFNKINKDKNFKARSAGLIRGSPLDKRQVKLAKKFGIKIKGNPKGLSTKLFFWNDITIIVADNVPLEIFEGNKRYGKELIVWKIEDKNTNIPKIMKKVDQLIKDLEKTK